MDVPLKPIVSSTGSATYHLAHELTRILTPLRGQSDSHVRNLRHFVRKIQDVNRQESQLMISFEVESWFTKVPTEEVLKIIEERLADDESLEDRTMMSSLSICRSTKPSLWLRYVDDTFVI